jgi:hypothetical protein
LYRQRRYANSDLGQIGKIHDWPINKDGPATTTKGAKPKGTKRAAKDDENDEEGEEVKKPVVKRTKGKKAVKEQETAAEEEADDE